MSLTFFIHLPIKMEPIRSSETSDVKTQTPGNYPKRNILQLKHCESLKTRKLLQRNECHLCEFSSSQSVNFFAFLAVRDEFSTFTNIQIANRLTLLNT